MHSLTPAALCYSLLSTAFVIHNNIRVCWGSCGLTSYCKFHTEILGHLNCCIHKVFIEREGYNGIPLITAEKSASLHRGISVTVDAFKDKSDASSMLKPQSCGSLINSCRLLECMGAAHISF